MHPVYYWTNSQMCCFNNLPYHSGKLLFTNKQWVVVLVYQLNSIATDVFTVNKQRQPQLRLIFIPALSHGNQSIE